MRISRCLAVALLLAVAAWQAPHATAQQAQTVPQAKEGEFPALLQRWRQIEDPEQKTALGEELLAREAALSSWPLAAARASVRAEIRFAVGSAYIARALGVRADNLEKAIAHLEAALTTSIRDSVPQDWARTHNNLGIAYWNRIRGERADNQERAIAHFEAALTVLSRQANAEEWAQLQNNLAVVYWNRVQGERAENLENAIAHFEAALTVFTLASHPHLWAMAENNLGSAYRSRIRGDRADNRDTAITHLEAALGVFTREAYPHDWALAHNNLAIAHLDRIHGDAADNREKAIGYFEDALKVFTREAYPQEWAQAQHNIAIAYAGRTRGERADNLRKAAAAYEAALSVFTLQASPRDHLRTSRLLARVYLDEKEWQKAAPHHASAREAFQLLFGQGLQEADTRALIGEAGPLFAEAAFAAIQRGEPEAAFELASEGRARLLAVSLRLQTLDLTPDQRRRFEELRAGIRTAQPAVEAAHGIERTAALERLIALRQELLDMVRIGERGEGGAGSALMKARDLVAGGGAVAVPVLTGLGARLLVVTKAGDKPAISVVDLPESTSDRVLELLNGAEGSPAPAGWLAAYFINYLQGAEQEQRWPEWLAAIDRLGPDLWRVFAGRLDAALKAHGVPRGARLVWLPSGGLGIWPLGLAQDPVSKRRLADDYEIVYAPSLDALTLAQKHAAKAGPATLAAIINPTGDLAGTEKEGAIVASYFAGNARTLLQGEGATSQAVLAALKGKSHWHFASHGAFSWQDARQSALLMHGPERLTVGRLLATEGLGHPRLVVLSACETGLYDITGNPDEFIGLPGTFTALGADGVLGTLWPVSDAATALLIAKFYELHMGAGMPPPAALSRAQAWLREATDADLKTYATSVAAQGRLARRQLAQIRRDLSAEGLTRSHNRSVIDWIKPIVGRAGGKKKASTAPEVARPYAHPFFWGGFIYTGL